MAHKIMTGGTVYAAAGGKSMVDGTVCSIAKGRTLIGGTGYDIPFSKGRALAEYAEGDIVYLTENGASVPFYVACHNYESGLNGTGRTLVVRKDCYDTRAWHSSQVNAWASCTLRYWLNGDYLNMLDEDIRGVIGTTKYYYTPGNGNTTVTTRSDSVFLLSVTELGKTDSRANTEGSALPIASTLQIAYSDGKACSQFTRSPNTLGTAGVFVVGFDGSAVQGSCTNTNKSRPCFTLPATVKFDTDTNEYISLKE